MSGKQGRRARRLQLRRTSLAHYIRVTGGAYTACGSCANCEDDCAEPIKLTAKATATSVQVHIKPDEFSRLLWGAQSWRRPH